MEKRGLSKVVAIFFIIMISVMAVILFWVFLTNTLEKQGESVQEKYSFLNCIQDVEISILDVCYQDNLLKLKLKNKRELILGDFFLVEFTFINGSVELIPTAYHTYLQPYETKTIIVQYPGELEKIKVIPKIETQAYLCPDSAPTHKNIGACQNEN